MPYRCLECEHILNDHEIVRHSQSCVPKMPKTPTEMIGLLIGCINDMIEVTVQADDPVFQRAAKIVAAYDKSLRAVK